MRESNLGISRVCIECQKSFWCDDGSYYCSDKCYDQWESRQIEDDE